MKPMTAEAVFEQWMTRAAERFSRRAPESAKLYEMAQKYLPGGDTRRVTHFAPYPLFIARGEGFRMQDSDGNTYIDFLNNYTSLIHGHAHPGIVKAATEQVKKGVSFAAPTRDQCLLAEMICERVKSVEQVRFCNSGTEATMNAFRAARIFSGRSKIVKMEGGYHGTHDLAEVSIWPGLDVAGPEDRPMSVAQNKGIPQTILDEVIVVPFNNKEVTERIIRDRQKEIACVVVEPIMGAAGLITPVDGYLGFLRDLTRELGILLVFDEVVTFRLDPGGAQSIYGVEPDLTAFGKIIGGGFPVGAFGGPREIMKIFSPRERGSVSHSGTFNGNPVTMAAGIACLNDLTPEVIQRINTFGDRLRKGIETALEKNGVKGRATGLGSLIQLHINGAEDIRDYRSAAVGNFQAIALLHLALLEKGINIPPRGGEISVSTPMTEQEIKTFLTAFEESLAEVRPFIEETTPDMIE